MWLYYAAAKLAAVLPVGQASGLSRPKGRSETCPTPGISVVIPSRNGKDLLAAQLPGIAADLKGAASEVIVVDNGSSDGTAAWLRAEWPAIEFEVSLDPLGFASAVNRGLARARYARICLLNNDMTVEPGFFAALDGAFTQVPDLFCATAQIRFPAGVRREETGKAVMRQESARDFPIRCDDPVAGEDLTWVLYGSGGCSLYDAEKLLALGGVDQAYDPAYVEDLDLGYRAWLRGWPSVYVAGALVEHRHRATTSRYFSQEALDDLLEINYLKFLARAVQSREVFRKLWADAIERLRSTGKAAPLRAAAGIALLGSSKRERPELEEMLLALTGGSVACFPGSGAEAPLVMASERLEAPTAAMRSRHRQVVVVRGSEDSPAFRAAELMVRH